MNGAGESELVVVDIEVVRKAMEIDEVAYRRA